MGSKIEIPVFTETNLGTRIAIAVSPDITAGDFKRELEKAHIDSFPGLGILTIHTTMVKQKSNFYCLPDLLPLKLACGGCRKLWFVHVNAYLSKGSGKFSVTNHHKVNKNNASIKSKKRKLRRVRFLRALLQGFVGTAYAWTKRKKRRRRHVVNKFPPGDSSETLEQENCSSPGQTSGAFKVELDYQNEVLDPEQVSESLSGAVTVSGIIDRYLSNFVDQDQIVSLWSSEQQADTENTSSSMLRTTSKQHSACRTSQRLLPSPLSVGLNSVGLRNKYGRSEVGERLVMASNSVEPCQSTRRSSVSKLSKGKRFLDTDAGSIARGLVFEIGDDD